MSTRSAFWGQSFVAELNRLSEHGERKLKMRRESLVASPTPPPGATGGESDSVVEGAAASPQMNGVDAAPDEVANGVNEAEDPGEE
jgi:hypothetical protein